MRENLQAARKDAGLTQEQLAERLYIDLRYYKSIESGDRLGSIQIWDSLEDILSVHQRVLRENRPGKEDSPQICPDGRQSL